jgi:hypothetical protein
MALSKNLFPGRGIEDKTADDARKFVFKGCAKGQKSGV